MLTEEQVKGLAESCSGLAYSNWDGKVYVQQDSKGTLFFQLCSEDGEREAVWAATPCGDFQGSRIYLFMNELDPNVATVHLTLVPAAIVGLLGL